MTAMQKLDNIIFWGGKNDDKSPAFYVIWFQSFAFGILNLLRKIYGLSKVISDETLTKVSPSPVRWDHDFILFASKADKLAGLKDPSSFVPSIFELDLEEIPSHELYDGVTEYKTKKITVELIEGLQYNEFKIYSETFDFDGLKQRLSAAGAVERKPDIPLDVPGCPDEVDVERLNRQRLIYQDEILEKDKSAANMNTVKSILRGIIGVAGFTIFIYWSWQEIFTIKYQDVSPIPGDTFITTIGNNVVYSINNRMTVFKFADLVEEVGYDTTYNMWIPEGEEVKLEIVVSRMTNADGDVVYDIGNRFIGFEAEPGGYNFVNATPFEFDKTMDWAGYGELEKGQADRISLQGRIIERNGQYLLLFGKTFAILGDILDTGSQFYDLLEDDLSYAAVLFSLKANRPINIYGQIQKTLTSREGRNSVDRKIFLFKTEYARKR